MKRILMLGTGGTIASRESETGLAPQLGAAEILSRVPELTAFCRADAIEVCALDSTDIRPVHWLRMAAAIRAHYDDYDGFVLCHGTDTMAYTAAALSYLIQRPGKPIVITGAQKPIVAENSDSKANLLASFLYACAENAAAVALVFDGRVILGTRARKVRTKSFDAFSSINYPELARVQDGRLLRYIALPPSADAPVFYDRLNERVGLLKLIPGTDAGVLSFLLARNDAVILESYGVGGVPQLGNAAYLEAIDRATRAGKTVVLTTQVQLEGSDIGLYRVGHALKGAPGILEAYDMTTEAVVSKLMWILGQTRDFSRIRALFYAPVAQDILYTEEEP